MVNKAKYLISETDRPEFWKLYNSEGINSLSVRPRKFGMVRLDIDVKLPLSEAERYPELINDTDIKNTIECLNVVLKKNLENIQPINLISVVKKKKEKTQTETHIKDGVHIEYPYLLVDKDVWKLQIIPEFLKEASAHVFTRYPDTHRKDIFDTHASASNFWLLPESIKKEGGLPYEIHQVYNSDLEEEKWSYTKEVIDTDAQFEATTQFRPQHFDISNENQKLKFFKELKRNAQIVIVKKQLPTYRPKESGIDLLKDIRDLLLLIKGYSDRMIWFKVGCIISLTTGKSQEGLELFLKWSSQASNYSEVGSIKIYQNAKETEGRKCGMGSLYFYAKQDHPEIYQKIIAQKVKDPIIKSIKENGSLHSVDCAKALYAKYQNEFVYSGRFFYQFKDNRWIQETKETTYLLHKITDLQEPILEEMKKIREKLTESENELRDLQEEDEDIKDIKKKSKELNKTWTILIKEKNKLIDTPFRNQVIKECMLYFKNNEFENQLDSNPKLLGFSNGVLDLTEGFREGRPEDYITFQMGVEYPKVSNSFELAKVKEYFNQVFQEDELREYVMTFLGTLLEGYNTHKHIHYFTGEGNNSKSVLIGILSKLFGDYAFTLSTSTFSGKRTQSSSCNPDLIKAQKKRIVVLQEASQDEAFNEGLLKELSGNDEIYVRGLYKDAEKVQPHFKLLFIQNNTPNLVNNDKAIWKRIRVVPFNTEFVETPKSENQLQLNEYFKFSTEMIQELLLMMFHEYKNYQKYVPEIVKQATNKAQMMNDKLLVYTQMYLTPDSKGIITLANLFEEYRTWYEEETRGRLSLKKLEFFELIRKQFQTEGNKLKGYSFVSKEEAEEKIIQVEDQDIIYLQNELKQYKPSIKSIRQKDVLIDLKIQASLSKKITNYITKMNFVIEGISIVIDAKNGNKWFMEK
jgi:P4 family phage/plasmid primase-like protien